MDTKLKSRMQNVKQGQTGCKSCTELAKLKSINTEMYEALKKSRDMLERIKQLNYVRDLDGDYAILLRHINRALTKAEGKTE